ncbi:anti-sigma-V factor rsiV [Peribacillus muralis]|uniref:anti-sigma-V factor rsiV n=1 Tax=Peribacillus muralis TaxID=264697 RepID=UPI001F4E4463|nr:anti-sigma-V factor rsiV [Peribacillus muralis]MCK1994812.1 anti-sigma-V factor rsiV [Peribacillus muralis]MCK2015361.1 anti-sigma-V factor rsiV [Peribacillus muralis]
MEKELMNLRDEYLHTPIPKELKDVVQAALNEKPTKKPRLGRNILVSAAAALLIMTASVNVSPAAAKAMSEIPYLEKVIKVITFVEWKEEANNSSAVIRTPAISGLENEQLEKSLNDKYLSESKQLYKEFTDSMSKLKEGEKGDLSVESGYSILTDNETILSVQRYTEKISASSSTESQFDTVDKKNEVLLTLNSLFKDDRYLQVISNNIKEQMKQQMAADPNKIYWVKNDDVSAFKGIDEKQSFYINKDGKLVIAFDSFEVSPGYMGEVEFIIPTKVISGLLVGDQYIH